MHYFLGVLQGSFTQVEIVDLKDNKELLILLEHHSYNLGATRFESFFSY